MLLDRSASMSGGKWKNAIESINAYVNTLLEQKTLARITIAAFDNPSTRHRYSNAVFPVVGGASITLTTTTENVSNGNAFDVMRNDVPLTQWKALSETELSPRGNTPLYDSTATLLNLAEQKNADKTVILIMTDGEENYSTVYTLPAIKDRIKNATSKGWEVVFLGAEFNVETQARSYGLDGTKFFSNKASAELRNDITGFATATASYAATGASMNVSKTV